MTKTLRSLWASGFSEAISGGWVAKVQTAAIHCARNGFWAGFHLGCDITIRFYIFIMPSHGDGRKLFSDAWISAVVACIHSPSRRNLPRVAAPYL